MWGGEFQGGAFLDLCGEVSESRGRSSISSSLNLAHPSISHTPTSIFRVRRMGNSYDLRLNLSLLFCKHE